MRHVEAWQFMDSKFVTSYALDNGAYDARALTKDALRTEVFEGLKAHYKDDLPRAMTHIIQWSEREEEWDYYADQFVPPRRKPDLKFTSLVIVEGFDV